MKPETQRLLLQRISLIEEQLKALKQLVQAPELSELFFDDDDITDAEIIEPNNTPAEKLLETLFSIMKKKKSTDEQKKAVTALIHSSISKHSPALDSFFRFSFKTFQDRWMEYLNENREKSSFQIERRKENNIGELMEVKLYLLSANRSPSPITFKQDPNQGMAWRIQSLSL